MTGGDVIVRDKVQNFGQESRPFALMPWGKHAGASGSLRATGHC